MVRRLTSTAEGIGLKGLDQDSLKYVGYKSDMIHLLYSLLLNGGTLDCPSPLYRAVDDGQREIISLLLEYSVGPQASALKLAVLREDESMIRFLLNNGFNVQEYAHSALFAAKMKGDQNIVGLLESRGATLDLHSNDDEEHWDKEDGDGVPKPLLRVFVSEEGAEVDESDADDDTSNVQYESYDFVFLLSHSNMVQHRAYANISPDQSPT
ncbi:uncharacterized protein LDX57_012800 [Aspergillus melleus]|uniref:uncharacterized protein n=1 Tax=Aspergillus melleus TaxID=138277 RepID=UPI001E8E9773|nr:uncharacterized protein LDX57_012800 [Aspergillus melleus]KAH8435171.1 hypothetical protein LDX57_012800 [Aspergillus melleus]